MLDEADEMLDLGFREDLEFILDADARPSAARCCSRRPSPRDIAALAKRYQRDALRIDTIGQNQPHGDIEYRAIRIAPNEIEHAVVNVLRYLRGARRASSSAIPARRCGTCRRACSSAGSPRSRSRAS